jgi:hypothetical protein
MEKTGKDNIKCVRCSQNAVQGTQPPMCAEHNKVEKTASADPQTLREFADNPKESFNG